MRSRIERPSKELLIELYADGKNYTDIGRKLDVSRSTVKNWFKEYQIYSPPGARAPTTPSRDELDGLISNGMSNELLAGRYQVHVTTISLWLRNYSLMSLKVRSQFRKMAEKVGRPKPEKTKLNMPVAGYGVPQIGLMIEYQMQAGH